MVSATPNMIKPRHRFNASNEEGEKSSSFINGLGQFSV